MHFIIYIFPDIQGFQCTACLSVFSTLDYLRSHARSVHRIFVGPDFYHCPHCNYSSQIKSIIERHSSTCKCANTRHNRNDGKNVASRVQDAGKSNVGQIQGDKDDGGRRSKGDYSKERPHTCATCEEAFKRQIQLTVHQRMCSDCIFNHCNRTPVYN